LFDQPFDLLEGLHSYSLFFAGVNSDLASERIKDKAESLKANLEGFKSARVEIESAESEYKRIYEHRCKGHSVHPDAFFGLAEMMVTKPLRLEVLAKLDTETKAGNRCDTKTQQGTI
jgi:hypothetical protein